MYEAHSITIVRNAQFLIVLISLITESVELLETFTRNVLYWGKPAQSVLTMNIALFGCVFVYLSLILLPLRTILVITLWLACLKNNEFFSTLSASLMHRLSRVRWQQKQRKVVEFLTLYWMGFLDKSS